MESGVEQLAESVVFSARFEQGQEFICMCILWSRRFWSLVGSWAIIMAIMGLILVLMVVASAILVVGVSMWFIVIIIAINGPPTVVGIHHGGKQVKLGPYLDYDMRVALLLSLVSLVLQTLRYSIQIIIIIRSHSQRVPFLCSHIRPLGELRFVLFSRC